MKHLDEKSLKSTKHLFSGINKDQHFVNEKAWSIYKEKTEDKLNK